MAVGDSYAVWTGTTRLNASFCENRGGAADGSGKYPCSACLTSSPWSAEKVGMGDPILQNSLLEDVSRLVLTDEIFELGRAVLAVECHAPSIAKSMVQ